MHQRVTIVYGLLLCAAFVVQYVVYDGSEGALSEFGLRPGDACLGRLATYSLLHLRFEHLLANLAVVFLFANYLETRLGSGFVVLILIGASIAAGLAHIVLSEGDTRFLHGSSGTAYALVTASVTAAAHRRKMKWLGFILAAGVAIGTLLAALALGTEAKVSHASHFGGALAGLFLVTVPGLRRSARRPG